MKSDAIAFGIAGVFFGLIAGWIIGTQQPTRATAPAAAAAPAQAAAPAAQAPPPFDESRAAALRVTADRNPNDAETRVQLGNLYFDAERYEDARK